MKRAACHILLVPVFQSVLDEIHGAGEWELLRDFGGIYNVRPKRTATKKASTHSWGIAGDFDVVMNPLGRKPTMEKILVARFEAHGFFWGGRWSLPDGMHMQYATGY